MEEDQSAKELTKEKQTVGTASRGRGEGGLTGGG